ncbi:MAG TPA: amidohydrolase family protein [Streptosporangiaceae bacterium]|nr:amidohydrolase family protein [Streptosporangiaceae bacterium]
MTEFIAEQRLVDHHCHGILLRDVPLETLESLLTEGGRPPAGSAFDSGIGFAFRRLCPPVLDLPVDAAPDDYARERQELGFAEVNRRFLTAAGLSALCVDTGYLPEPIASPQQMSGYSGAAACEVVRLEQVAEAVGASQGVTATGFADAVRAELGERTKNAVAVKSIAAYRTGLALNGERPAETEVTAAAGRFLAAPGRLADQVLQRFLIWCADDLGLPVQFHVGYGDRDVNLDQCNPLLLTPLLRGLRVPVMLLHNYPFHREAGYLAQVFPNVYVDAGLATHGLGFRAPALLAEALELAPYGKFVYSSDAFGLPELFYLGAALFRRALAGFLRDLDPPAKDAERITRMIGAETARRVYRLPSAPDLPGRPPDRAR